jgi:predicted Ser/Thr protein kinase/tetratricopeptide (TPR) repeat protein
MTADGEWDLLRHRIAAAPDPVAEIRSDQAARWRRGDAPPVEEYLYRFPAISDEDALVLIFTEVALRRARGEAPGEAEYRDRFPRLADDIAVQFGLQGAFALGSSTPVEGAPTYRDLSRTKPACVSAVLAPEPAPAGGPGYEVIRELGRGGMGVVYLARQHGLNRTVALKTLLGGAPGSNLVIRFLAEAEAVASVRHTNVVEVYQFGERDGRPYLAMEFCPNGSLADKLAQGPLAPAAAAAALAAVAEGVAAAHAAGIVHRDLKPQNVLVAADGQLKVTDFGLAKRLARESDLTNTNAVMGTPAYMAPEQAQGGARFVGPAADVWALGVMLYELTSGQRPFRGEDTWQVLGAVMRGRFVPLRAARPGAPRDLDLICAKCLSVEPRDRYADAGELAQDLRRFAAGQPVSVRPPGPVERAARWARRNKLVAGATAAVVLALAAGLVGTAIGLARADAARARAEAAEQDARDRLAERVRADEARQQAEAGVARGYVQSAELAMQRGAWWAALDFLDRARAAGHPDEPRLPLHRVRARVAIHDAPAAAAELRALADRTELGDLRGRVLLWRADLALARACDRAGRDLVGEALKHPLPPADEAYARGLLAPTVPDALGHFRRATELDPFHHRATGMAAVLLVALGRMSEARATAELGGRLFPEDPTFGLLVGLVDVWDGRAADADARLARLVGRLDARQRGAAKSLFDLAREARRLETSLSVTSLAPLAIVLFVSRAVSACESVDELRQDGSLLLPVPPVLVDGLTLMSRAIPLAALSPAADRAKGIDALRKLAAIYPNGLVNYLLGINQVNAERLADAEAPLRAAVDGPSFVPLRRPALVALAFDYWQLAVATADPPARRELFKRATDTARELSAYRGLNVEEVGLIVAIADAADDPLLARAAAEWAKADDAKDLTILRLWAKAELKLGADETALTLAKRILKDHPDDPHALHILDALEQRLKDRLKEIQRRPAKP